MLTITSIKRLGLNPSSGLPCAQAAACGVILAVNQSPQEQAACRQSSEGQELPRFMMMQKKGQKASPHRERATPSPSPTQLSSSLGQNGDLAARQTLSLLRARNKEAHFQSQEGAAGENGSCAVGSHDSDESC